MTDLTPNDLSHLSDEEFNALCPQGEHAPGPEPLSPTAKAVLAAAGCSPQQVAAALRALADQAHPKNHIKNIRYIHQNYITGWKDTLDVILAIATELEGQ